MIATSRCTHTNVSMCLAASHAPDSVLDPRILPQEHHHNELTIVRAHRHSSHIPSSSCCCNYTRSSYRRAATTAVSLRFIVRLPLCSIAELPTRGGAMQALGSANTALDKASCLTQHSSPPRIALTTPKFGHSAHPSPRTHQVCTVTEFQAFGGTPAHAAST
jgi:hypothetical protein